MLPTRLLPAARVLLPLLALLAAASSAGVASQSDPFPEGNKELASGSTPSSRRMLPLRARMVDDDDTRRQDVL